MKVDTTPTQLVGSLGIPTTFGLAPRTLALMHGSSFSRNGKGALYDLAAAYAEFHPLAR